MRQLAQQDKEVPDNTVFWSIVGIISVFVVVLATVMLVRNDTTGNIVLQWEAPSRSFEVNPYACLDVPPCGSETSFMCCAESPLPGTSQKCMAPMMGRAAPVTINYRQAYANYGANTPVCPLEMPYRCTCPEKYQYRQSWPVPSR
jgi:hypothetical protein